MISVVIPTLNAETTLPATLTALVPAALDGLVREVIVVDGGSKDCTREIADQSGAELIAAPSNRGAQMRAGANAARHAWLLFLNADTILDAGWEREAAHFMERVDSGRSRHAAAAFRFALDDDGFAPRALEGLVRLRCATLRLPYGEQGLLIARSAYDKAGGHRAVPLMEDVDLVRRIGLRRVKLLRSRAVSDAARYRRDGYLRCALGNQAHRIRYALHLAPARPSRLSSGGQ
ncbi:MAG TPA: glycosyltransferase [Hyphomicrobium sp.]|jgi:rSAM/selenodomain-associated transferase 2